MRSATLMSLALAGWLGAAGPVAAAPLDRGPGAAAPAREPASPTPAAAPAPAAAGARPLDRRRRTSYAACNRESHRRNLYGGVRRRFLIRCRLGYERRAAPSPGPARKP